MHILVIEDDTDNIELLQLVLEMDNYDVVYKDNGEDGYIEFVQNSPDLLILDLNIPRLNGLEIINKIKQNFPDSNIPILVITGSIGILNKERMDNLGINRFFIKPVRLNKVLGTIRNLLTDQVFAE